MDWLEYKRSFDENDLDSVGHSDRFFSVAFPSIINQCLRVMWTLFITLLLFPCFITFDSISFWKKRNDGICHERLCVFNFRMNISYECIIIDSIMSLFWNYCSLQLTKKNAHNFGFLLLFWYKFTTKQDKKNRSLWPEAEYLLCSKA